MLRYAEAEHRTDKAAMRTFADIFSADANKC